RAVRPDLQDGRGLRRSAGEAYRHRPGDRPSQARPRQGGGPGGDAEPHAVGDPSGDAGARRAYGRDPARIRLQRQGHRRVARQRRDLKTMRSEQMISPSERMIAEKDGAIGWMIFNNPERRNALSLDMWQAIPAILDHFDRDPEVRVVVLKGAGDKA